MSKISLQSFLDTHHQKKLSYEHDIYFKASYARLYGEVFEFEFKSKGFVFKSLGIKSKIANTPFFDLQSPYGYSGFYANTDDKAFLTQALKALKERALKEKIIAFFVRFHPFDDNLSLYENELEFFKKDKKIVLVPLENGITHIRSNYSPRIKSYVKKARTEIKIQECFKDENQAFIELYTQTMQRNKAGSFYYFDKTYFDALFDFEEYKLFKALDKEGNKAYASFFMNENFAYYHLSANSKHSNASAALLDFAFEYGSSKGVKFCILGGGMQDDDSLYYFKERFSTLWTYFCIGGMIFDHNAYTNLCKNYKNSYFLAYRQGGGALNSLSFIPRHIPHEKKECA
ncbi:hypothetical protein GW575_02000 [Campylobacter sp. MIT 19-121]|uniref:hypothetical protein n=1 Tax=Campylobacter sp. MIT 19-121 TaxID=2703906 RepID=UPI0013897A55|nr:hypothetical protein [Campylobacter sp. MIT 19-121]NDJ26731.1 hypothetical protein [Campylobacter sp. MIT 19-121]